MNTSNIAPSIIRTIAANHLQHRVKISLSDVQEFMFQLGKICPDFWSVFVANYGVFVDEDQRVASAIQQMLHSLDVEIETTFINKEFNEEDDDDDDDDTLLSIANNEEHSGQQDSILDFATEDAQPPVWEDLPTEIILHILDFIKFDIEVYNARYILNYSDLFGRFKNGDIPRLIWRSLNLEKICYRDYIFRSGWTPPLNWTWLTILNQMIHLEIPREFTVLVEYFSSETTPALESLYLNLRYPRHILKFIALSDFHRDRLRSLCIHISNDEEKNIVMSYFHRLTFLEIEYNRFRTRKDYQFLIQDLDCLPHLRSLRCTCDQDLVKSNGLRVFDFCSSLTEICFDLSNTDIYLLLRAMPSRALRTLRSLSLLQDGDVAKKLITDDYVGKLVNSRWCKLWSLCIEVTSENRSITYAALFHCFSNPHLRIVRLLSNDVDTLHPDIEDWIIDKGLLDAVEIFEK